jgi:hypothetical protein
MSNPLIFSRAYLQSIPEQRKQQAFSQIINQFHSSLVNIASTGKTSYMVDESIWNILLRQHINQPIPAFTNEEIIAAIEKNYPDCKVTYEENWVDTRINNRTLKKGIMIDWS